MTDNRTNEPTPEQVEAAAKALRDDKANRTDTYPVPEWEDMPYGDKLVFRGQARAALVAAQGAGVAPQEPCPQPCEHLSAEDAREGRDCREHPCTCPTAPSSDREKLIEEARAVAGAKSLYAHTSVAHLLTRLADALVAAQGAAPQAESDVQESPEIENLGGEISIPVQPSSTVDEEKIAEVERAAAEKALDSVGEVLWVHRKSGGGPDDRYAGMMRARFLVMQSASAYRREETE